jgi:two-component system, cell cycle sensor histidine kinase and response regulator CckA
VNADRMETLRRKAEARLSSYVMSDGQLATLSVAEVSRLMHELHTHQIELTIQNEELIRTQAQLSTARDRYADLFDHAPVGYLTLTENLVVTEANTTSATLLGIDRADLVGHRLEDHVDPGSQDQFHLCRRKMVKTEAPQVCELTMKRGDTATFVARVEIQPAAPPDGRDLRVTLSDVTEHKRGEDELHRLHNLRSLGLLAGGIAHDFNNALTGVTANLSLLLGALPAEGESQGMATEALEAVTRASKLNPRQQTRRAVTDLFFGGHTTTQANIDSTGCPGRDPVFSERVGSESSI